MKLIHALGLAQLYRLWALAWYRRALTELSRRDPLHADIPHLVMTVNALERA